MHTVYLLIYLYLFVYLFIDLCIHLFTCISGFVCVICLFMNVYEFHDFYLLVYVFAYRSSLYPCI